MPITPGAIVSSPGATIIAHALCRDLLIERGIPALESARKQNQTFRQVKIILPQMTFSEGTLNLRVGKKNLSIMPAPGHSPDGIAVLVEEDRVLFAGDSFMPLPYVVDGDAEDITASIKKIGRMGLENIIQGHGDIILRGEIDAAVKENLNYLTNIRKVARTATRRRFRRIFWMKTASRQAARAASTWAGWQRNFIAGIYARSIWKRRKPGKANE